LVGDDGLQPAGSNEEETMNTEYQPRDYTLERWMVALLSLLFLLPFVAQGQETTTLEKAAGAELLLKTAQPGVYAVSAAVKSEVHIQVTGPIVRTTVKQTFHNTTGRCVEGLYVYPLPEMSAVDTLTMTAGSRTIAGEIRERDTARREYEAARSEGRRAALVEQQRPNVFTTSVAGLMPDEDAVIEIAYQETARYENGEYRLRFPMVVAPRFTPSRHATLGLPLTPSSEANKDSGSVSLSVDLQPGFSVRDFRSPRHLVTQTLGDRHYLVSLAEQQVPQDRDFELAWKPDLGSNPMATVLTEKIGTETYALLLVTPPPPSPLRLPRETVFIIDSSGSMAGASMEQAKEALLLALDDLRAGDRFNIIDFDSVARPLFHASMPAGAQELATAKQFVAGITADGGTEMMKALELALPKNDGAPQPAGQVRQVIFMTDGQVGNEQELFTFIHDRLGDSRLFTVGIGSAPNAHFMRNAARFGRGTYTYISDVQQVKERMGELFAKLDSPIMTAVDVRSSDVTAESWPSRVPDLYSGEPLVVAVQLHDSASTIHVRGMLGGQAWECNLALPAPSASGDAGIGRLWGRQKIESLMDGLGEGRDPAAVRSEVVEVALRHHLASQYTSLVAIDKTPQGLTGQSCKAELLPAEGALPGDEQASLPQTATPAPLLLLAGAGLIALALILARLSS
jgi:Ca-activated chloride channel family protein